jgi:thiosulfate dehydrogenase (quinone) large subunit
MNNSFADYLFKNPKMAPLWVLLRLYVGLIWLQSGVGKLSNSAWVGENAGAAIKGFAGGALAKAAAERPDVSSWYAWFLENVVLAYPTVWSYMIVFGEILVGLGLVLGIFVGLSAFFGGFMNLNFLWAGTVSINPTLLVISIGIVLARKSASRFGLEKYLFKLKKRRLQ